MKRLLKNIIFFLFSCIRIIKIYYNHSNERTIYLFNTPSNCNLGDQAICIATKKIIQDNFKYKIVEIPCLEQKFIYKYLKKIITTNDIIVISGGGNMSPNWLSEFSGMKKVLTNFPNIKTIIFPQSLYFNNTQNHQKELNEIISIIKKHTSLLICLRDKKSYEFCNKNITKKTLYIPDIALYLNYSKYNYEKKEVLLIFRKDKEKILNSSTIVNIKSFLKGKNIKYKQTSTVKFKITFIKNRAKEFQRLINKIQKSSLVITDRLHGMIFAVITGTPCIAFNNSTDKIKYTHKWLSNLNYIKYIEANNVDEYILKLMKNKPEKYDFDNKLFNPLIDYINNL